MNISRSILLLIAVCTAGGLTLAAGLYSAHHKLGLKVAHRDALALAEHQADRLDESLQQWLLWSDLILGNGNTYLTKGALDHAKLLHRVIDTLQSGPAGTLGSEEITALKSFVDDHSQRLDLVAQGGDPAALNTLLNTLDRESPSAITNQQNLVRAVSRGSAAHRKVLAKAQVTTQRLSIGLVLLYVAVVLIAYRYTTVGLIEPMRSLTRAAADPDLSSQAFSSSKRGPLEIRQLAETLAGFSQEIQSRIDELNDTNRSLNTEVQERQHAEKSLRDSQAALKRNEQRFRAIFSQSNDGIFVVDMEADIYRDVNPQACAMMGYDREELLTLGPTHFHAHELDRLQAFKNQIYANQRGRSDELSCLTKSGDLLPVEVSASTFVTAEGKTRLLAMVRDISDRKESENERQAMHERLHAHATELESQRKQLVSEMEQRQAAQLQLEHDASHDALTHLPNRRWFKQRLNQRSDQPVTLLFIDLDDFKLVNDSLGHDAGDMLLVETAKRLRACLAQLDCGVAARLGGDEFVVMIESQKLTCDTEDAARMLQDRLAEPMMIFGQEVSVGISIGIAGGADAPADGEDLLRDADTAMYRAKLSGKARHAVFDQSMHDENAARLALENDLRHAVLHDAFEIAYQPLLNLKDARIASFEALARWDRPGHGYVSPADFIPLAEELNLIVPLGAFVLAQACQELVRFNAQRSPDDPVTMAVNVSRKQLIKPGFVEDVRRTLDEAGVRPEHITIEVTESMIMADPETARSTLQGLVELGVRTAMDDFGTGYSSLCCLNEIPLDVLKIDQAFISNLDGNIEHSAIINAIITLADHLKLEVVAEGIETLHQMAQVLALGCAYGQGYLFSKPVPADDARAIINTQFNSRSCA